MEAAKGAAEVGAMAVVVRTGAARLAVEMVVVPRVAVKAVGKERARGADEAATGEVVRAVGARAVAVMVAAERGADALRQRSREGGTQSCCH